jgi:hypothetical protein
VRENGCLFEEEKRKKKEFRDGRSAPKDGRVSKAKILNVQPPIISIITSSGYLILSLSLSRARALSTKFTGIYRV